MDLYSSTPNSCRIRSAHMRYPGKSGMGVEGTAFGRGFELEAMRCLIVMIISQTASLHQVIFTGSCMSSRLPSNNLPRMSRAGLQGQKPASPQEGLRALYIYIYPLREGLHTYIYIYIHIYIYMYIPFMGFYLNCRAWHVPGELTAGLAVTLLGVTFAPCHLIRTT